MHKIEIETAKQILEKIFSDTIAKTSTILVNGKVIKGVQVTIKKPISSDLIGVLHKELYENKLILDYRFGPTNYGITVALFTHPN